MCITRIKFKRRRRAHATLAGPGLRSAAHEHGGLLDSDDGGVHLYNRTTVTCTDARAVSWGCGRHIVSSRAEWEPATHAHRRRRDGRRGGTACLLTPPRQGADRGGWRGERGLHGGGPHPAPGTEACSAGAGSPASTLELTVATRTQRDGSQLRPGCSLDTPTRRARLDAYSERSRELRPPSLTERSPRWYAYFSSRSSSLPLLSLVVSPVL